MGEISKIAWTDATFSPWWGCTKVSPGCNFCYAEPYAHRFGHDTWGQGIPRRYFGDKHWADPIRWDKKAKLAGRRLKVFCASMADVFDNEVEVGQRHRLWSLINDTPNLDWLLLTKRIGNVKRMLPWGWCKDGLPKNVWLGISVVNQEEADRDIPKLLEYNGLLWLSIEPQLESITLRQEWLDCQGESEFDLLQTINWIVVGGESGSKARPMQEEWARSLMQQCKADTIPFFMKQGSSANWPDFRNFESFPRDLQVREHPSGI